MKLVLKHQDLQTNISHFYPLNVVGRGSETQHNTEFKLFYLVV